MYQSVNRVCNVLVLNPTQISRNFAKRVRIFAFRENEKGVFVSTLLSITYLSDKCVVSEFSDSSDQNKHVKPALRRNHIIFMRLRLWKQNIYAAPVTSLPQPNCWNRSHIVLWLRLHQNDVDCCGSGSATLRATLGNLSET
jgi:hypothetical protein